MTRRRLWFSYPYESMNAVTYWLRYALSEPRDFAYAAPRRLACRFFGHHSAACRGVPGHPRG
ncbi:hypothetical protein [Streptomyces lavendofoliae]|uniref:Uncharacterized protein n=1 Tax=Streptomyces lavendofoliae TaxID=67314 RepID=A0A918M6V7_9ACTN|nr:hypothetical protein [Streptomyces lavendofoliae]GGU62764.1 hypothetical protein GCM10010274_59490 [Streptomyces lavendofoliae]